MTCVMSGHQVVHIGVGKDCCPQPKGKHGAHLSATCCVFAHTVPQRSEYTAPNFRAVHPVEAIPLFLPAGNATSTDLAASRGPIVTRPPPLLRAERSSRLRSFLI